MEPFLGDVAIKNRSVTRGVLRSQYKAVLPNVYLPKRAEPTLVERAKSAWLWSGRSGVIAGRTAAGVYLRPDDVASEPIEIITAHRRLPNVIVRNERISIDEVTVRAGLMITTPARTALDIARHLPRDEAVMILDALAASTGLTRDAVWPLVDRYAGARGIARAREAVLEMDGGASCPEETRVRLILSDGGLRPTDTQIRIVDGQDETVVAMGWPQWKVAVDCNHAAEQKFPKGAVVKAELLQRLGWLHIEVLPTHTKRSIVSRTRAAIWSRLRTPQR